MGLQSRGSAARRQAVRAAQVRAPTTPSAVRPRDCWKAWVFVAVIAPKTPSAVSCSRGGSAASAAATTAWPLEPRLTVTTSADHVFGPTTPSAARPLARWKEMTRLWVVGPNAPSTVRL